MTPRLGCESKPDINDCKRQGSSASLTFDNVVLETQVRCLDSEDSDNLPGDKQREIGKIGRLKLGVGPGDTSEVFGQ